MASMICRTSAGMAVKVLGIRIVGHSELERGTPLLYWQTTVCSGQPTKFQRVGISRGANGAIRT